MSGICGLSHANGQTSPARMFARLGLPGEELQSQRLGSAAMGVARRWDFQQLGAVRDLLISIDADLLNAGEIAATLKQSQIDPANLSLAEQLCYLYLLVGPRFVERLRGGFSLALWDETNRRLILAIDPAGIKGLYWCRQGDQLLFASRASAVRDARSEVSEIEHSAIIQYLLFSVVPAPLSVYKGIEKLRPGHLLTFENGHVKQVCYWDLAYPESKGHNEAHWAEQVREGIRQAVHAHLVGCDDDRTGAYLSGGTDSSSVVAFMSERFPAPHTCSIFFSEAAYSEIGFARTTAEVFRTRHHERRLLPEDACDAILQIAAYYDEPFANSSAIGAYYCALLAKENGIDTLLAGDGGDELFGGNSRYADDKRFALYASSPAWVRKIIGPIAKQLPASDSWLSLPLRYVRRAQIPNPRRIFSYGLFLTMPPEQVFEEEFLRQAPPERWMSIAEGHFQSAQASSELNRLLHLDLKLTLADNDLRKVNGTAELAGVRVRYPMLDLQLAELSGRIPTRLKLKGFEKRYIFKRAMKGILPDQILHKKKHGFGVPLARWLLQDTRLQSLLQDVLSDTCTRQRGYFRPQFIERLAQLHHQDDVGFYGEVVWYLVALELWHRQHLESRAEELCAT